MTIPTGRRDRLILAAIAATITAVTIAAVAITAVALARPGRPLGHGAAAAAARGGRLPRPLKCERTRS